MSGDTDTYQVVFLIDLHTCVPKNETDTSVDKIGPCISLSALRILTLLSGQVNAANSKQANVRWGFKFYNSVTRRFQKYDLRDFTREEFDKFETEVDSVIESEITKSHGLLRKTLDSHHDLDETADHQVIGVPRGASSNRRTADEEDDDAVDKLQSALRDIVSDFQWDRPDITSPVKNVGSKRSFGGHALPGRRKLNPGPEKNESSQYNLTFLLSKCPHSSSELAKFVGVERAIEPQDVLSSFMPTSIYRQFFEYARIRLFWVDLNVESSQPVCRTVSNVTEDVLGLCTMHEALASIGGGVLPINTIIQQGSFSSIPIQSLADSGSLLRTREKYVDISAFQHDATSRLILPHSVLLKWSMKNTSDEALQLPIELRANLIRKIGAGNILTIGELDVCAMNMSKKEDRNNVRTNNTKHTSSYDAQSWSLKSLIDDIDSKKSEHSPVKCKLVHSEEKLSQNQACVEDNIYNLNIYGTVRQSDIPLQSLDSTSVYIVRMTTPKSTISFPHLISQLAAHNLVLVVVLEGHCDLTSHLGVLQPLTFDLATLTFVRTDMKLSIEKEFLLRESSQQEQSNLNQFISKHVEKLCRQAKVTDWTTNIATGSNLHPTSQTIGFQSACTEPWFRSSVTSDAADGLIKSLYDRESEDNVETTEVNALQAMQKLYHEQMYACPATKPKSTPRKKTSSSRASPRKSARKSPSKALRRSPRKTPRKSPNKSGRQIGKNAPKRRSATALTKSRSFTAPLGRTAVIIQKSQLVAAQNQDENEGEVETTVRVTRATKKEIAMTQLSDKDFQDEGELVEHLKKYHESFMNGDSPALNCAQVIVNVVLHYTKSTKSECPEKSAEALLKSSLIMTTKQIKEKYQGPDENVEACVSEYQIQILLYMELESLLMITGRTEDDQVQTVQEVTSMLTRMTLLKDNTFVGVFMREILVENYVETVPRLLANVYEELMLPLPPQLESLFSGSDDDTSAMTSSVQPPSALSDLGSVSRSSWSPATNRNMRSRRPVVSIANINMGKNRQIALPAKPKQKDESKNQKRPKRTSRPASAKKAKEPDCPKSEVKMVRRNLFMGDQSKGKSKLDRHQSVPVMDVASRQAKTPKKKLEPRPQKTPKSHHILKTKKVQETPVHKQVQKVMWRKLEKERRRVHTASEVEIIEESPNKAPSKDFKISLARRASVGNMRRTSFYSAGSDKESRSVSRYKQLEARMTRQNPLTSPRSNPSKKESPPRRIQPVNLFANLCSPSPQKTPGRILPSTSTAVRSLRDFDMDSPSKNTRTRSLFAPPEVEQPSTFDEASESLKNAPSDLQRIKPALRGFGSPLRMTKHSSPRRVVLQGPFPSPHHHSMPSIPFTSPVKSGFAAINFKTPEKSSAKMSMVSWRTDNEVFGSPTTPRRSKRLTSPTAPSSVLVHNTPDKHTPKKRSPQKMTPKKRFQNNPNSSSHTPVKCAPLQHTPRKGALQKYSNRPLSGQHTPTKDDGENVLENWARKALRNTPQRQSRLSISSPFKGSPVSQPQTSPCKASRRNLNVNVTNSRDNPNNRIFPSGTDNLNAPLADIVSPRRSTRLTELSPTSSKDFITNTEPTSISPPQMLISSYSSMSESTQKLSTSPTPFCKGQSLTPPHDKPAGRAKETTPSRRFREGKITQEPSSPLDSWPRRKPKSSATHSPTVSPKLGTDIKSVGHWMDSGTERQASEGDNQRRKRTFSSTHDDETNLGTPSKRRRKLRTRNILSSSKVADSSLDYFGSSEVFIENTSLVGSTKENSPTDPTLMHSPSKPVVHRQLSRVASSGRILRSRSSGSDSLSNLDSEFTSASVDMTFPSSFVQEDSNAPDSPDGELCPSSAILTNKNEQSLIKFMSPSKTNKVSPSTIGRKYSPSISTMSLAHLMQSPLLEDSNSPSKCARGSRSRVSQGASSRRSLYKTGTPTDQCD